MFLDHFSGKVCIMKKEFQSKENGTEKYSPRVSCHVNHTCQIFSWTSVKSSRCFLGHMWARNPVDHQSAALLLNQHNGPTRWRVYVSMHYATTRGPVAPINILTTKGSPLYNLKSKSIWPPILQGTSNGFIISNTTWLTQWRIGRHCDVILLN